MRRSPRERFRLEGAEPASDGRPRLRCPRLPQPLELVLVAPEIPPNTGNVARLCAATGSRLHLVEPLGFRIDAQAVRRAGLDYWSAVELQVHVDFGSFLRSRPAAPLFLFSARASRSYLEAPWEPGSALVFGSESTGLPEELLARHVDRLWGVPTCGPVRSLNLASAAAVVLYEALRALGGLGPAAPGA